MKEHWFKTPKESLQKFFPHRKWHSVVQKANRLGLKGRWHNRPHKVVPLRKLTDFERGYIAGIIDGEGSICMAYYRKENRFHPTLNICNRNLKLLKKCNDILANYGYLIHYKSKYGTCWVLCIAKINAIRNVLERITNSLIVKKKQAQTMLRFLKLYDEKLRVTWEDGKKLYLTLKKLNKRFNRGVKTSIDIIEPPNN